MTCRLFQFTFCYVAFAGTALGIEPVYEGVEGIKEQVFAINCLYCHSSTLFGAQRNGAPAGLNWDVYEVASANGNRIITRAVTLMDMPPNFSGIPTLDQEQQSAMLAWQAAGFPQFSTGATYDFSSGELTLPVVIVGSNTFQATLRLIDLPGSTMGFGFELVSAELTGAQSETAAVFSQSTGFVSIPRVSLLGGSGNQPSDTVSAEMVFIAGSQPFRFEVTAVNFIQ